VQINLFPNNFRHVRYMMSKKIVVVVNTGRYLYTIKCFIILAGYIILQGSGMLYLDVPEVVVYHITL
jgi:hypothetical protein